VLRPGGAKYNGHAMKIDRAGWPFVLPPALLAAGLAAASAGRTGFWVAAGVLAAVACFMVFFFRDPDRSIPGGEDLVIAPADGRVLIAGEADPSVAPPGSWTQISVFLSPVDVHVNRIPVGGRVTKVEYKPGRFLAAYRWEAASANERNDVWIEHAGETVVCRQVVGVLARRLVCRIGAGDEVLVGQRYGLMKFGSRIDLFLPRHVRLRVGRGDRIRGGETVVASW
jgi:phosphatidylserine decarboxylase